MEIKTLKTEQIPTLPEEIIEEILSRLPVKFLLQFRVKAMSLQGGGLIDGRGTRRGKEMKALTEVKVSTIIEDYGYGAEDELLSLNKESSILKLTTGGFTSALDPTRVTQNSWSPRAFLYRGFLTDKECDHLITLLRQEKIAERIRALQELVPSVNKTDRAAKLDEIVDYVKFLRLQVKWMERLGGISYGGYECIRRAKAAEYLVRAWIEELYPGISNHIVSYIFGLDSLKATSIGDILPKPNEDIRLRMDDL
ncbi:hypothetical protein BUALT_Bualt02G0022100 [Buddleja alternifolia]|uniref:BHLH domain-containing protein n=1 Tax=Buddleja alternifolia TaxID=168488 RepID=A0AAV6Y7L4_9LAMI|nr:hypothetical protein BUALT_Bualt02G0022100 [Buddleja alternifolia]